VGQMGLKALVGNGRSGTRARRTRRQAIASMRGIKAASRRQRRFRDGQPVVIATVHDRIYVARRVSLRLVALPCLHWAGAVSVKSAVTNERQVQHKLRPSLIFPLSECGTYSELNSLALGIHYARARRADCCVDNRRCVSCRGL